MSDVFVFEKHFPSSQTHVCTRAECTPEDRDGRTAVTTTVSVRMRSLESLSAPKGQFAKSAHTC